MKYTIRFVHELEDELIALFQWYQNESDGLGERFLDAFYAQVKNLTDNPKIYQRIYKKFRRVLLYKFPFGVYYTIENDTVVVYGCFHTRQNPKYIYELLKGR
jgi:toxin ParE1/3/4